MHKTPRVALANAGYSRCKITLGSWVEGYLYLSGAPCVVIKSSLGDVVVEMSFLVCHLISTELLQNVRDL